MDDDEPRRRARWPAWAREFKREITQRLQQMEDRIMADQDKLDADVQALSDGLTAVEKEIADLKNQPPAAQLDFTGLDAAVARLSGDAAPPAPTPAP